MTAPSWLDAARTRYVVFDASAIKSAIGNSGLDLDTPSMTDRLDESQLQRLREQDQEQQARARRAERYA